MITQLNHITLAVSNLERSMLFYTDVLGLKGHVRWEKGAYLTVGSLWICLSVEPVCEKADYTHFAFEVSDEDFDSVCADLKSKDVTEWKQNTSEGRSLYILDPDGHKLEIHVGGLDERLASLREKPYSKLQWLS